MKVKVKNISYTSPLATGQPPPPPRAPHSFHRANVDGPLDKSFQIKLLIGNLPGQQVDDGHPCAKLLSNLSRPPDHFN